MGSKLLNGMKHDDNYTLTENGGITHKTTESNLLDMFAMGGAMRERPAEDVILMFKQAYQEDPEMAMKLLFYLRDVRGGQGELQGPVDNHLGMASGQAGGVLGGP